MNKPEKKEFKKKARRVNRDLQKNAEGGALGVQQDQRQKK